MAMMTQRVLGHRYVLGELIARGGMSDVYRAEDRKLQRAVAVKLARVADTDRDRFEIETRLLAQLHHRNLVSLFDAGIDDGHPYLVLELADGPTLEAQLRAGALPAERVATIGIAIAEALAYLHSNGVVHRDVKPSNVLTRADETVALGDLGVARVLDAASLTRTGTVIGTARYLAPEQAAGEAAGTAADIYSLGLVLAEALQGRPVFTGPSNEALLARLTRDPDLGAIDNPGWRRLLTAMTARQLDERPDAVTARAELARLADTDSSPTAIAPTATIETEVLAVRAPPTAPPALELRTRSPVSATRKRLIPVVVVGGVILSALLLAATLVAPDDDAPSTTVPTTVASTAATPASTTPTTTLNCDALRDQREAINDQRHAIDEQYRDDHATRDRLRRELDDQRRALEEQLRDC